MPTNLETSNIAEHIEQTTSSLQQFEQLKQTIIQDPNNQEYLDQQTTDQLLTIIDTIYNSKEFSIQQLQKVLEIVSTQTLKNKHKNLILNKPVYFKQQLQKVLQKTQLTRKVKQTFIKEEINQDKQEINQDKQEIKENKEKNLDQLLSQITPQLQQLQASYPQLASQLPTITQTSSYYEQHQTIFTNTPFQTRQQQQAILHYKYMIEAIKQDIQSRATAKQSIPQQEYDQLKQSISSYNTFASTNGIQDHIDSITLTQTPRQDISTMADLIHNDQLGENLYNTNTSTKDFIDQQAPAPSLAKIPDDDILQHIVSLFPEDVESSLQNIPDIQLYLPQLLDNNTLQLEYLRSLPSQVSQSILNILTPFQEKASQTIQEQKQLRIKQHALTICLQSVAQYFDQTTRNLEQFAQDTKLDNISIQDDTVYIQGNINGSSVTIRYNLTTGQVASKDFIHLDDAAGMIHIDNTADQREVLDFQAPTLQQSINDSTAQDATFDFNKTMQGQQLQDFSTTYYEHLRKTVYTQDDQILAKDIIEHNIEVNIASTKINQLLRLGIPPETQRNKTNTPQIFQLYTIIDNTLNRYSPHELRKFRNLSEQLHNTVTTIHSTPNYQPERAAHFFSADQLRQDTTGQTFYQLFHAMTHDSNNLYLQNVIDISQLQNFVTQLKNPDPNWYTNLKSARLLNQIQNQNEQYTRQLADTELEQKLQEV
jgi:hypothetical protein